MLIFVITMMLLGAVMGSFSACQVRRLRWQEEKSQSNRQKKQSKRANSDELGHWSVCLHCRQRLKWYDNIPVISWLILRGRCRSCGQKIGKMEFFSEVGLLMIFGIFGIWLWSIAASSNMSIITSEKNMGLVGPLVTVIIEAIILLIAIVGLWILLLYDAMWQRMPVKVLTFCIICAIMYRLVCFVGIFLLEIATRNNGFTGASIPHADINWWEILWSQLAAIGILSGLYFLLYRLSGERLAGSGDWLLCLALSLLVGNWWLALIILFLANFLASIVMLPVLKWRQAQAQKAIITTKTTKVKQVEQVNPVQLQRTSHQIAFGPFLVVAFLLVYLVQGWLLALV